MIPTNNTVVRPATAEDTTAITRIYNHYIANTIITFEEEQVSCPEMAGRIREVQLASLPWLVAVDGDKLLGFAYAGRWRGRCAYRYSVETTVYLDYDQTARGLGSRLYSALLPMLKKQHMHAALGGIALPNDASVALHEKFGFVKVAHFREVGFKFDRWIDVGYWECVLDAGGVG